MSQIGSQQAECKQPPPTAHTLGCTWKKNQLWFAEVYNPQYYSSYWISISSMRFHILGSDTKKRGFSLVSGIYPKYLGGKLHIENQPWSCITATVHSMHLLTGFNKIASTTILQLEPWIQCITSELHIPRLKNFTLINIRTIKARALSIHKPIYECLYMYQIDRWVSAIHAGTHIHVFPTHTLPSLIEL